MISAWNTDSNVKNDGNWNPRSNELRDFVKQLGRKILLGYRRKYSEI